MPSLYQRDDWCYGYGCSGAWSWGRWILFVLFIIGLILVILCAIRINKRRGQEGRQPIMGTAWITPPSYMQSQTQNPPYVPEYSERTNDNDMGYYDAQGQFHANPKLKEAFGENPVHLNNLVPDQTGQQSYYQQRTGDNEASDFNRDFARYYGNAAATTTANSPIYNSEVTYDRPENPPPAHTKS